MLIRIESSYFVAGVIFGDEKVIIAAPIIKYMIGWNMYKVINYCKQKNWKFEIL